MRRVLAAFAKNYLKSTS